MALNICVASCDSQFTMQAIRCPYKNNTIGPPNRRGAMPNFCRYVAALAEDRKSNLRDLNGSCGNNHAWEENTSFIQHDKM